MEEIIKKWLFDDWNLCAMYETINNIKENEIDRMIMFKIGKLLSPKISKITNFKRKVKTDNIELYKFDMISNTDEKHTVKIYYGYGVYGLRRLTLDKYVDTRRFRIKLDEEYILKGPTPTSILYDKIYGNINKICDIIRQLCYNEYDEYSIYRRRKIVLLILLAKRDKHSILSALPKEILLIIAKKIWY
jgi:hypothetical protein